MALLGIPGGRGGRQKPWLVPGILDYWDARTGITESAERVSAWAARVGAHSLDQGTGANQPILLPYSGTNYLWLPGVAANTATTPDAAALDVTGDIDLRARVAMNDWGVGGATLSKGQGGAFSYFLSVVATSKNLRFAWSADGTSLIEKESTAGAPVSNFEPLWIRATLDVDNGASGNDVRFYTSSDGVAWTQLGNTVTTAGATSINNSNQNVTIGSSSAGSDSLWAGKVYRAQIRNGIDGTVVFDADFTQVSEGAASFTESSSNAATVTINKTGTKEAQIVGSQQLLGDGAAHVLSAASVTLNQPFSFVLVGKQVTWADSVKPVVAFTSNAGVGLTQRGTTPAVRFDAGSAGPSLSSWTIGAFAVVSGVINGASSQLQLNLNAPVTGDTGAIAGSEVAVFGRSDAMGFANIQLKALALANSALSQQRLNQLVQLMAAQHGVIL